MTGPRVQAHPDDALIRRIAALRKAGASDDEVAQLVDEQDVGGVVGGSSSTAPAPTPYRDPYLGERADAIIHGLSQGLTLGFGDEILGNTLGRLAGKSTQDFRERGHALAERNPGTVGTAEFAGALAPAVATGSTSGLLARKIPSSIARGALTSGIAGVGASEGSLTDRAKAGAVSAGVGGAITAALPPVAKGVASLAGGLYRGARATALRAAEAAGSESALAAAGRNAGVTADRLVGADVTAANKTLQQLREEALAARGTPQTLADLLGTPGQRRLRGAVGLSPGAEQRASQQLGQRALDRTARLEDAFTQRSGVPRENLVQLADNIEAQRAAEGAQNYGAALSDAPVNDPRIFDMLDKTPSFRQAWAYAQKIAEEKGETLPTLFDQATEQRVAAPSAKSLHYLKLALDDMVERAPMNDPLATGSGKTLGAAVAANRGRLLSVMDEVIPGYQQARSAFADKSKLLRAIEEGQGALNKHPDVITSELATKTPDEQLLYRRALGNAVLDRLSAVKPGENAARKVFGANEQSAGPQRLLKQLRAAFPDDESYQQFLSTLTQEGGMAKTEAVALSGSRTAPMAQDIAGIEGGAGELVQDMVTKGPQRGLFDAGVRMVASRAKARTPKVADALAENLLQDTTEPETLVQYLDRLDQLAGKKAATATRGTALARALGRYAGMQTAK